jgi:hypothetical protein
MIGGCSKEKQEPVQAPAAPAAAPMAQVVNWGPKGTAAGKGFSVQSNGNSAIWFEAPGIGNANTVEVWFGDRKLEGMAITPGKGGSAEVPPELITKAGRYPIYLVMKPSGARVDVGTFEVTAN